MRDLTNGEAFGSLVTVSNRVLAITDSSAGTSVTWSNARSGWTVPQLVFHSPTDPYPNPVGSLTAGSRVVLDIYTAPDLLTAEAGTPFHKLPLPSKTGFVRSVAISGQRTAVLWSTKPPTPIGDPSVTDSDLQLLSIVNGNITQQMSIAGLDPSRRSPPWEETPQVMRSSLGKPAQNIHANSRPPTAPTVDHFQRHRRSHQTPNQFRSA